MTSEGRWDFVRPNDEDEHDSLLAVPPELALIERELRTVCRGLPHQERESFAALLSRRLKPVH